MTDIPLASEFPRPTEAEWRALVEKSLRGAPHESLKTRLYEGFETEPLYTRADGTAWRTQTGEPGAAPYVRGVGLPAASREPWVILQLVDHLDIDEANRQLRQDLSEGAGGLWVQLGGNIPYGGAYLGARTLGALDKVFQDVGLANLPIYVSGGTDTLPGVALLLALAEQREVSPDQLKGSAGLDPLSLIAASGEIPAERDRALADAIDAAMFLRERGYGLTPFLASGRAWHQAGGSAVEELAFTLSAAVAYWRALAEEGVPLADAARMICLHLTADANIFVGIAKFRAARALWARATEAAGIGPQPAAMSGEMSYRMLTERDPFVNLLRATASTFAASLGGAEAILLIPFNAAAGTPDSFGRRLARNTQLILQEESYLGRVADAPGGAWYIERLTEELAARAWSLFREVEAEGGLLAALESGLVGRKLSILSEEKRRAISRGQDPITGVSAFPDLQEKPTPVYMGDADINLEALEEIGTVPELPVAGHGARMAALIEAARSGATLSGMEAALHQPCDPFTLIPDPSERMAEAFEMLRYGSDRALETVGARPTVFLANLGKPADFTARSFWAKNFFEAGGIEALTNDGFGSVEELIQAFRESGASVACLCGSNTAYAEFAGLAPALKQAGATGIYVAGGPETLRAFGQADKRAIDRLIYDGCDMLAILTEAHRILRVEEVILSAETTDPDADEGGSTNGQDRDRWFLR